MLTVSMGDCTSTYPVWVYKKTSPECPKNVYETRVFDEQTRAVLQNGGRVYLSPDADKESLPYSIKHSLRQISGRWELSRIRRAVWGSS